MSDLDESNETGGPGMYRPSPGFGASGSMFVFAVFVLISGGTIAFFAYKLVSSLRQKQKAKEEKKKQKMQKKEKETQRKQKKK